MQFQQAILNQGRTLAINESRRCLEDTSGADEMIHITTSYKIVVQGANKD